MVEKKRFLAVGAVLILCTIIFIVVMLRTTYQTTNDIVAKGEWIAFSCELDDQAEIYAVRPDGSELTQITNQKMWSIDPHWSPDGQWIVFVASVRGTGQKAQVYKVRSNGTEIQQLTRDMLGKDSPVWSPDGQWIAFASESNGQWDIYRMKPDGTQKQKLTSLGDAYFPVWSPDGATLSFAIVSQGSVIDIYRMYPDGSDLEPWTIKLTSPRFSWSPNGDIIAFASAGNEGGSNIYKMPIETGATQQLTHLSGANGFPSWSPDGQWVVFTNSQIQKMKSDGSQIQQLTTMPCAASFPVWFSFRGNSS